jgi:flavin-dependent dehydrogenase
MTNLKPVDVAIVGGGWSGLAMAKEITTRSGLNVVVLELTGSVLQAESVRRGGRFGRNRTAAAGWRSLPADDHDAFLRQGSRVQIAVKRRRTFVSIDDVKCSTSRDGDSVKWEGAAHGCFPALKSRVLITFQRPSE